MHTFFEGLLIGFSIAAPVGPIGLLCIRRSMADGRLMGFVTGLGAATADACYGIIAALGLTTITHFLLDHQRLIQLIGGGFLLYLGISIIRTRQASRAAETDRRRSGLAAAYASTFALTLTNPATILAFAAIFAAFGLGERSGGFARPVLLVTGVFAGSAAWWLILSSGASWVAARAAAGRLRWINLASGSVIAGFGAWQLVGAI